MIVAVTGASGFIGKHVLSYLIKQNIKTIGITRDHKKLSEFADHIEIVEHDISKEHVQLLEKIGSPDILIHLAWDGLPNYKSSHHFESELPIQYNFIKSLIKSGLERVFVAGTCFEYGMQSGELKSDAITCPNNSYGYAKDSLRKHLSFLKNDYDFDLVWGRLFYMFGEGQSENSLYSQLTKAILQGEKVFNMSGGEQIRDYLHVSEVAQRIVEASLKPKGSHCLNICSGKPVMVKDLVQNWLLQYNSDIKLNLGHYPYPDYEPLEFWGETKPHMINN